MRKIKIVAFLCIFSIVMSGLFSATEVNCAKAADNDQEEEGEYVYFTFPEPDYINDFEAQTIENSKSSKKGAKVAHSYQRKDDEDTIFAKTWELDGNGNLRTVLIQDKSEWESTRIGCNLYTEKQDKVAERKIRWTAKAKKALDIDDRDYSITGLWYDSDAHYLYAIIAHYAVDPNGDDSYGESKTSKSTLYVISTKGNVISQTSLEDNLLLDKMSYYQYCPGFYVNFVEKSGDIIYLSYEDASNQGVFMYDTKKKCFVKQVITSGYAAGILHNKNNPLVVTSQGKMALCNIPAGDEYILENGSKLTIAKAEIQKVYQLPKYRDISIKDDYIYILTYKSYLRFKPGKDKWEALATVPDIVKNEEDCWYQDFIAIDKTHFAIVFYDEWYGYYVNSYKVQ